ncbi:helix-turn-helix domain-containing protein [Pseudoflavonifractor sp. 524-17]|uniref:LexA family protein n=1 Tax=Pseudoflavonifractor sp. 524-17 TaxID=2304577 RepID=UPI0013795F20|nr:LexA family transcriptional regulator [Pseudoflavonifractor sp. 524-17]NCE65033.1 helix-turn-helix domain-containing protein [Pseudoflavonifractor sp. 524-17]
MTTGQRIKALRLAKNLSQQELGALVGVKKAAIHKYESGIVVNLKRATVERLARALDTTPAYLLGLESAPLPPEALPYTPTHRIPILGRIAAGLPIYAEQNIEGYTYTDLNGNGEYFALRITGDSMNALGINDGYLIIVRRQDEVENGEVAVVLVDGEDATVKRFYTTDSTVTLMPQSTNPIHQPQIYDLHKTSIKVLGKVVKVEFML